MIRSMTGYGRGVCSGDGFTVTAELRSINHRHTDFFLRVPRELYLFEDRIRNLLKTEIRRGRVEVNITMTGLPAGGAEILVNEELAAAYYRALAQLSERIHIHMDIGAAALIQLPGILQAQGGTTGDEHVWALLETALREALRGLIESRDKEGGNLCRDLQARLEQIVTLAKELGGLAPAVLEEQRLHLEKKLMGMLEAHFDQSRVLMECAILAERLDIHEEMVRLGSHLEAFGGTLCGESPVGRRLDFMAQEIFREINTIGAKSQDYRIAALVVEIKTELEKIREQVQNIE